MAQQLGDPRGILDVSLRPAPLHVGGVGHDQLKVASSRYRPASRSCRGFHGRVGDPLA